MKPEFFKNKFSQIYWISPTNKLDAKLQVLTKTKGIIKINTELRTAMKKEKDNNLLADPIPEPETETTSLPQEAFIEELDLNWLEELQKSQEYVIKKYGKGLADQVLLILDDSIASRTLRKPAFKKFLLNSRHYNISTIFSAQSYMMLDNNIRINNSFLCVFNIGNMKNLKQIYDENDCQLDWKDWYAIYKHVVSEPYAFLSISSQNDPQHALIKCFKEFLMIQRN
jgi:hypothetical protein